MEWGGRAGRAPGTARTLRNPEVLLLEVEVTVPCATEGQGGSPGAAQPQPPSSHPAATDLHWIHPQHSFQLLLFY